MAAITCSQRKIRLPHSDSNDAHIAGSIHRAVCRGEGPTHLPWSTETETPQSCVASLGRVFQRFRFAVHEGGLLKNGACGLRRTDPVQCGGGRFQGGTMKKLVLCMILAAAAPAWSQTKLAPDRKSVV